MIVCVCVCVNWELSHSFTHTLLYIGKTQYQEVKKKKKNFFNQNIPTLNSINIVYKKSSARNNTKEKKKKRFLRPSKIMRKNTSATRHLIIIATGHMYVLTNRVKVSK